MVPRALYDARELELLSRDDRLCRTCNATAERRCGQCPALELCLWVSRHEPSED